MQLDPSLKKQLELLYPQCADQVFTRIAERFAGRIHVSGETNARLNEQDVVLIAYGDSVRCSSLAPLACLKTFLGEHGKGLFNTIHILPCYPYSSDDGFSVIDYKEINPELGSWQDINALSRDFKLMLDGVVNHASSKSGWFERYLNGDVHFSDYFIEADPEADYSSVVRPRTLPLLTRFETADGEKWLWTTFSNDQIDLNFKNPDVLLQVLDILLFYADNGAAFIRLDAIGFIWKNIGTSCIHLPETHAAVQVIRHVFDKVAPGTLLITETNVPHRENISYFGNGENEAHLVYQFPLPPLVLHSFVTGRATYLTDWAKELAPAPKGCAFFNFLSSHDGIGVRPVEDILPPEEMRHLLKAVRERGGEVSYKNNSDGNTTPYELNITYRDALCAPDEDLQIKGDAMIAAHAILLAMQGVPAIYFNSFVGGGNDYKGVEDSGIPRRINRKKYDYDSLCEKLADEDSLNRLINRKLSGLLETRKQCSLFSPEVAQEVVFLHPSLFALRRFDAGNSILCVTNVSRQVVELEKELSGYDLLTRKQLKTDQISPHESLWLETL